VSGTGAKPGFMLIRHLDEVPRDLRGAVVAIGNFDGVHLGHRALLNRALEHARTDDCPAMVMTFEPHPRTFFRPDHPVFRLTSPQQKAGIFRSLGFDAALQLTFDRDFASMPATDFIETVLVQALDVRHVVTGADFHFGAKRQGTPEFLREASREKNFGVSQIEPVLDRAGEVVSSSRVRNCLAQGDITGANALLGRPWQVRQTVMKGRQVGRGIGYPTANMILPTETGLRHGIYAVRVLRANGDLHDAVASFGTRPTFDDGAPVLETFLFDFSGDIYGEEIAIEFHAFLRGEEKFDSVEALVRQMDADSEKARAILREAAG
jgi:riboflavin kinase / FMN adenylyltransferase